MCCYFAPAHKEDKDMDSGDICLVSGDIKCNNPSIVSKEKNIWFFPSPNKDVEENKLLDRARETENSKVTDTDTSTSTLDVDTKQNENKNKPTCD